MDEYTKEQRVAVSCVVGVVLSIPLWCFYLYDDSVGLAVFSTFGLCLTAYKLSSLWMGPLDRAIKSRRAAQEDRKQDALRSVAEAENRIQSRQMGIAQSKQEIVMRLGTIDQYLRVYRSEADASRRVVALQAAHGELTNLNVKLAASEIDLDALRDARVQESAKETIADLGQAGLTGDRLTRDLRRMFNL